MTSILLLSDIGAFGTCSPGRLAVLLKERNLAIDVLLIAGVLTQPHDLTFETLKCSLTSMNQWTGQLMEELELKREHALILPNPNDLKWSYGPFSEYFYAPVMGAPFDQKTMAMVTVFPYLQILALQTTKLLDHFSIREEEFQSGLASAKGRLAQSDLPPGFARSLFVYHPISHWHDQPAAIDQAYRASEIHFLLSGQKPSTGNAQNLLELGISPPHFRVIRQTSSGLHLTSTTGLFTPEECTIVGLDSHSLCPPTLKAK